MQSLEFEQPITGRPWGFSSSRQRDQEVRQQSLPFAGRPLGDCILRSLPFADLATVDENRELLRPKPQEYFGIEAANVSPSSWQAAVEELNKVNNQRMPSGKLRALLTYCDLMMRDAQDPISIPPLQ